MNNFHEFAMGGNPVDAGDTGYAINWRFSHSGDMFYIYPRRIRSDLVYRLEETANPASNIWVAGTYEELPLTAILNDEFESVTNEVPVDECQRFVRLRIE